MEQLLTLAQRVQKTTLFLWAHCLAGETLSYMGEFVLAREHLRQSLTFYKSHTHRSYYGPHDPIGARIRSWQGLESGILHGCHMNLR